MDAPAMMMASAECCFSVTIDGRTERVPSPGERLAAHAIFRTCTGDSTFARSRQIDRLASINTVANRTFNVGLGYRLLLSGANRRPHRCRVHRRGHERHVGPPRPGGHVFRRLVHLSVSDVVFLSTKTQINAHHSSIPGPKRHQHARFVRRHGGEFTGTNRRATPPFSLHGTA